MVLKIQKKKGLYPTDTLGKCKQGRHKATHCGVIFQKTGKNSEDHY